MSESTTTPPVDGPAQVTSPTGDDNPTDWKSEARKWESRAKQNADAAKKLAELEDAHKSADEKAAERQAAAEKRAAEAEARALRREVALEHSLNREDAALLDAISDEQAMNALAKRLAAAQVESKRKSNTNYVPGEGNNQTPPADETRAFVRRLTGRE